MDYIFLQNYWWFLVSLLGALLVFLLFVQGGNSLLFTLGRTHEERTMLGIPQDVSGSLLLLRWLLSEELFSLHSLCFIAPASVVHIGCG